MLVSMPSLLLSLEKQIHIPVIFLLSHILLRAPLLTITNSFVTMVLFKLLDAARDRDKAVVKQLLDGGANPDSKSDEGWRLLSRAAENGNKAVELLLDTSVEPNLEDENDWTA